MLDQPVTKPLDDECFILVDDYIYEWSWSGGTRRLLVPKDFIFDGASIPQVFWSLGTHPHGLMIGPACVHDYLYKNGGQTPYGSDSFERDGETTVLKGRWGRKDADRLFAKLMREAGIAKWRRRLIYYTVRVFGGRYWES